MKKHLFAAAGIALLLGCTDTKKQEKDLLNQVIAVHDKVMANDEQLMKNKMLLDSLVKNNAPNINKDTAKVYLKLVDDADNANEGTANNASRSTGITTSNGPHRLILQDAAGTKIVALEYKDVNGISIEKLAIGAKFVLKDIVVARGMALLTPETVTLLGGKIEAWDTTWRQKRKEVLLTKIEALHAEQNGTAANEDVMEE